MSYGLMEQLVEEDYGLEINGQRWARSKVHDSLVVDRENQLFYWNSENIQGDPFIYLIKVRKLNYQTAKEFLKNSDFSGTFIHEVKDGEETVVYPKLIDVFHSNIWNVSRDYFYNRTLTDETISRFKLGFYNDFYMIPIFMGGMFKQFQMRRDSPKLIRNYYKNVGPLLFNSDLLKITNKIYITEGLISALVLSQNGIPAVAMNVGCDSFQPDWISHFIHQKEIYILFDHDKAGDFGSIRTAKILGEYRCKIYNMWDFDGQGFAVDDYFIDGGTVEELNELIEDNSKYAFELESVRPKFSRKIKSSSY